MLREVGVGYISEVLLQLSRDLSLRGRIERVIELPECVRRSYKNQAVELVAGICLIQRPCDFVDGFRLSARCKSSRGCTAW